MVQRAKHLQNAFKRHTDNAFHTCHKGVCFILGNIGAERQLPQLLVVFGGLAGGSDDDFCPAGVDDAVVVEMRRHNITDMCLHGKDFIAADDQRVAGQVHLRIEKGLCLSVKNAHRHAGKVADGGAKIGKVDVCHDAASFLVTIIPERTQLCK